MNRKCWITYALQDLQTQFLPRPHMLLHLIAPRPSLSSQAASQHSHTPVPPCRHNIPSKSTRIMRLRACLYLPMSRLTLVAFDQDGKIGEELGSVRGSSIVALHAMSLSSDTMCCVLARVQWSTGELRNVFAVCVVTWLYRS